MNSNFQSPAGYVFLSSTWGVFYPRTSKHFSRCPVDLTLEQTVNRDAASRHTGIAVSRIQKNLANDMDHNTFHPWDNCREAALDGWFVKSWKASQESKSYRIIRALRSTMNPFNAEGRPTDNAKLYYLSSGRAASNDMKDDLINVVSIRVLHHVHGQTNFGKSVKKIQPGKKRFEKPIKRRRLKISQLMLKR